MTQERDDYMRRQEADHDLLRMRDPHMQRFGRGTRLVSPADMQHVVHDHGTFTFPLARAAPTTIQRIEALCVAAGASPEWFATIAPGLGDILRTAALSAFERGSDDARSRAANKPGDGDMGG